MNLGSIPFLRLRVLSEVVGLESKALDFALVFSQPALHVLVYMELPAGIEFRGTKHEKLHIVLLKEIVYRLKQASANWYTMLKEGLQIIGFHGPVTNPCVF